MISIHIENGAVLIRRAAVPKPKPGSVLIRLRIAGICNTDIELLRGYYGFRGRPGHDRETLRGCLVSWEAQLP